MINLSRRNIIIAVVVLILAIAIPVTVRLTQKPQQLKSKASEENCNNIAKAWGYSSGRCDPSSDTPAGCDWSTSITGTPDAENYCFDPQFGGNGTHCYFCGKSTGGGGGVSGAAKCTADWSPSSATTGTVTAHISNSDGSPDLGGTTYNDVQLRLNGRQVNGLQITGSVGVYPYNISECGNGQQTAQLWYPSVNDYCSGSTAITEPACPNPGGGTGPGAGNPSATPPGGSISFNSGQTSGPVAQNQAISISYSAWTGSGSPISYIDIFQRCTNCSDTSWQRVGSRRAPQNSTEGQYLSDSVPFTPTNAGTYQVVINVVAVDGGKCSGNPEKPSDWASCGGNGGIVNLTVSPGSGGPGGGGNNVTASINLSGSSEQTINSSQSVSFTANASATRGTPTVDIYYIKCPGGRSTCTRHDPFTKITTQRHGIPYSDSWKPPSTGTFMIVVNAVVDSQNKCTGGQFPDNDDHLWQDCGNGAQAFVNVTAAGGGGGGGGGASRTLCGVTGVPDAGYENAPTTCGAGQYLVAYDDGTGLVSACYQIPAGYSRDPNDVCKLIAGNGGGGPSGPTGGTLTCSRFELNGLSSTGTNSEGGQVYNVPSAGSNNQINMTVTPDSATATVTATTQTSGAPQLNIAETNIGSSIVRTVNIPPNTSMTQDNSYMVRAVVTDGVSKVNCLPIQVVVPKASSGSVCPAELTSTDVKFRDPNNSNGSWVTQKTINQNQSVLVAGFHNGATNVAASDVTLSVSGPQGFSGTVQNGGTFTPPSDLPSGTYTFTATTMGKVGNNCTGTANLTVQGGSGFTPPPFTPPPTEFTQCVVVSDDKIAVDGVQNCSDPLARSYNSEPLVISGFTFADKTPGVKTVFVKYISNLGRKQSDQASITFNPQPTLTNANCTQSSSGPGTDITILGTNLGDQGTNGSVKVGSQDANITNWDSQSNTINAHIDQRITGKNDVVVTLNDGRTAKGTCTVNTVTVDFTTALLCKSPGNFATDNVDVKVFEAIPNTSQNLHPDPILHQKISLDNSGAPQGFSPIFEKNKKYEFIIKAPGTLAKRVDFDTKNGGTVNLNGGSPIFLPQGDIAPVSAPDGKINAFDKSELMRQWSLVTDVVRTGDLNGDSRVNSVDYACMRPNINQSDDVFSPINAPTTTPTPRPATPSPGTGTTFRSPTPTPSAAGIPVRLSFNPDFSQVISTGTADPVTGVYTAQFTLPSVTPGVYSVYVQYFQNGAWVPTPPLTANIRLN